MRATWARCCTQKLHALQSRFPQIGRVDGKGLVAGVACVQPGTKSRWRPRLGCGGARIEKGVLMFAPGRVRRRHGQDLAAAGDHRRGDSRKRRSFRGGTERRRRGPSDSPHAACVGRMSTPSPHHRRRHDHARSDSAFASIICSGWAAWARSRSAPRPAWQRRDADERARFRRSRFAVPERSLDLQPDSYRERIARLPPRQIVLCGRGPGSTCISTW